MCLKLFSQESNKKSTVNSNNSTDSSEGDEQPVKDFSSNLMKPSEEKPRKQTPQQDIEYSLLLNAVQEYFVEQFYLIDVGLTGVSIERRTINLSKFYKKYGIAKGHLKGSWNIFNTDTIDKIIDSKVFLI